MACGGRVGQGVAWAEHRGNLDCLEVATDKDLDVIRETPALKAFLASMGC
jgi:hypothetical protein